MKWYVKYYSVSSINFIMSWWSDMSSIIRFHLWILLCHDEVICQVLFGFIYEFYYVAIFSILGQLWLASIRSSWRGRPESATGGSLLPRAALLLLPHARRWEAPAAATSLLLPRVCRRWEVLAAAAPLLLSRTRRSFHRTTRGGDVGGSPHSPPPLRLMTPPLQHACWLLWRRWYAWRRFHPMIPARTPRATTMNAPTSIRWAHIYELLLDFNCLVELLNVYVFIFMFKS
jgi:hypothetical protein